MKSMVTTVVATSSLLATAAATARPCDTDLNQDGRTDGADLTELLASWGNCTEECNADFDNNNSVDGADLTLLLSS